MFFTYVNRIPFLAVILGNITYYHVQCAPSLEDYEGALTAPLPCVLAENVAEMIEKTGSAN